MAVRALRVLLVGGPMYDPLYARLPEFERRSGRRVQVAGALPHPALNARVAEEFGRGTAAYDLISTHTKYAPSQRQWLTPLDGDLTEEELAAFHPGVLDLARIDGALYGLPRNLDVKLLYYRTDLFAEAGLTVPQTWDALAAAARRLTRAPGLYGFAFPGRESGLFGHFFELHAMAGGRLFDEGMRPGVEGEAGRWALGLLVDLYRRGAAPPETPEWHYDEVASCFRSGRAAMTTDWPGGFYTYEDEALSAVGEVFDLALYPAGPSGRRIYAGSHTFAIPVTARDRAASLELLRFLTSEESQRLESERGSLPVRPAVLSGVRAQAPPGSRLARRWALLEESIGAALFPPALARWPGVEEAIWRAARAALLGELSVDGALAEMTAGMRRALA